VEWGQGGKVECPLPSWYQVVWMLLPHSDKDQPAPLHLAHVSRWHLKLNRKSDKHTTHIFYVTPLLLGLQTWWLLMMWRRCVQCNFMYLETRFVPRLWCSGLWCHKIPRFQRTLLPPPSGSDLFARMPYKVHNVQSNECIPTFILFVGNHMWFNV